MIFAPGNGKLLDWRSLRVGFHGVTGLVTFPAIFSVCCAIQSMRESWRVNKLGLSDLGKVDWIPLCNINDASEAIYLSPSPSLLLSIRGWFAVSLRSFLQHSSLTFVNVSKCPWDTKCLSNSYRLRSVPYIQTFHCFSSRNLVLLVPS